MMPFASLVGTPAGLVAAALIGLGFGFVLERSGFGRAPKLAAQFYLYDMTVFKVMFGAIVTAMLGVVGLAGLGVVDLASLSEGAVSATFVWPMLFGGLLLGVGFIISGYCPGTSIVATASGNLDGLMTVLGVLVGSMIFGELYPVLEPFYLSGSQGQLFLYQWLDISPVLVAVIITAVAVAAFFGAEKLEKIMTARIAVAATVVDEEVRAAPQPRRFAFGFFGVAAAVTVVTLLLPAPKGEGAQAAAASHFVDADGLARRIFDRPWELRLIDLRAKEACAEQRVPGAECVPADQLGELGLAYGTGSRDLVLIDAKGLQNAPAVARDYPGKVLLLEGGHAAWQAYALTEPEPLAASASAAQREAYTRRLAIRAALTGRKAPPPPAAATGTYVPKKKKKGGGCG